MKSLMRIFRWGKANDPLKWFLWWERERENNTLKNFLHCKLLGLKLAYSFTMYGKILMKYRRRDFHHIKFLVRMFKGRNFKLQDWILASISWVTIQFPNFAYIGNICKMPLYTLTHRGYFGKIHVIWSNIYVIWANIYFTPNDTHRTPYDMLFGFICIKVFLQNFWI